MDDTLFEELLELVIAHTISFVYTDREGDNLLKEYHRSTINFILEFAQRNGLA